MNEHDLIHEFMDMYFDARSSGTRHLKAWLNGERPKSPNDLDAVIDRFVVSLTKDQHQDVEPSFAHFLDLAFYILLVRFEHGEGPWRFRVALENSETNDSIELVGPDVDRELRYRYHDWVEMESDE
jgi:hypothetical protein